MPNFATNDLCGLLANCGPLITFCSKLFLHTCQFLHKIHQNVKLFFPLFSQNTIIQSKFSFLWFFIGMHSSVFDNCSLRFVLLLRFWFVFFSFPFSSHFTANFSIFSRHHLVVKLLRLMIQKYEKKINYQHSLHL